MNNLEGILVINKPIGMTSRDVVNILNKELNTKKIGHTGTLDPIASGVLVVLIGKYTKLANELTNKDKEYIATFDLGYLTDTLDTDGKILHEEKCNKTEEEIKKAVLSFKKTYMQEVPIYSAVKVKGKRLYKYAWDNEDIVLPSREVTIYDIEYLGKNKFKAKVSKGTYIRSLIRDIGLLLDTNATMTSLERIKQGIFDIKDAYTLEDIKRDNYKLLTAKDLYKSIELSEEDYKKASNGVKLSLDTDDDIVLLTYQGKDICLYKKDDNFYKMFIKFA